MKWVLYLLKMFFFSLEGCFFKVFLFLPKSTTFPVVSGQMCKTVHMFGTFGTNAKEPMQSYPSCVVTVVGVVIVVINSVV